MAEMVLGEQQPPGIEPAIVLTQQARQHVLLKQLLAQPDGHGGAKGPESARSGRDEGFEQPLEFQERLVVEGDVVDLGKPDPGLRQHIIDRKSGIAGIVLLAAEAFLLRGSDNVTVHDERRRTVVIEGGQAQGR